ncbi:hypothetical protein EYC84_004077 [Monilinia fructicola]|uniref:FAD-binding PCMH-type domain-containing protein n=1 Tax=Monilinia fructicola TaxID=38448 RepID=A0A5M9K224_MONFR|nr:hypothetical protein EYC84_004077 [Monilinia fructicola]
MPMKSECSRLITSVAFLPWVQSLASPVYNFCERLSQSCHGETYLSSNGSQYYVLANNNWFAAARNTPICIVTPTTPHELAVIVKALASVDVQFAVRSGGRSPAPKAANIRDGVLIDMSLFNEVSYDATTNLAVIGPGLTWGAVYKTLEAFKVTVVGGRVTDVGVGGLILGGGLSYLSDKYGLACANVVSFQVVLGNGSIVTASASENSELHWALKGGANIFELVRFSNGQILSTLPRWDWRATSYGFKLL